MDQRDRVIIPQVAFKGAVDMERDVDLTTPEGQARFETVFSFLTESLFNAASSAQSADEQMAQVIQGQFPGSTVMPNVNVNNAYSQPQHTTPAPPAFGLTIKGTQHGPLPDWLFEQAAQKGVTEVYDNRDRAAGSKRPWFRATTGGDNAAAFWPPR